MSTTKNDPPHQKFSCPQRKMATTENFMLTTENDPHLRGFVCPQRNLSSPCAISHGHNGI